jgi:hypothetical protein
VPIFTVALTRKGRLGSDPATYDADVAPREGDVIKVLVGDQIKVDARVTGLDPRDALLIYATEV